MARTHEKLHFLIVEESSSDSAVMQDQLKEQFSKPKLHFAASLAKAAEIIANEKDLDIILLDLSLRRSEERLVRELIRLAGTIPVIVLTNYSDKDFGLNAMLSGACDYLIKDELVPEQLLKSIIYCLDRKQINLRLKESNDKYHNLFNINPLPQWVFDLETLKFLDVNEAAINHYGYSRDEFLAMTIQDIRPSEDIDSLKDILNFNAEKTVINSSAVRHLKKSGEIFYVNLEGISILFEGRKSRLISVLDITEKIKAEQSLSTSEKRFKALVQEGSDLIGILDLEGNYLYVSPTSLTILGIAPEEFIGKNAFDFISDEDKERVLSQFEKLGHQKRIEISPFRFRDSNNNYRWIETVITNLTDDPSVGGIVSNSRDVTLRIENEKRIKETIERYNTVSKATSDTIYEWDLATDTVLWSQGMQEVFGHQITKSSFVWWYEHVHPDDAQRIASQVQEYIKNRESRWRGEYRFRCADGSYKYVMDRSFLVYNGTGHPVRMIGSIQNITERKNYIQAIEDQNKRLREISWIQSHIVRAPLARIMGLIDLLKTQNPDEQNQAELLQHILTSADELDEVIKSIISRTEQFDNQHEPPGTAFK